MRTLRQHVQEAERIWSTGGVRTLLPKKEPPAPVKVAVYHEQLVYAISVRTVVEKLDRTGWACEWLYASDDVARDVWNRIPSHAVCPLCLGRVPEERIGKGRVYCQGCGAFVRPKNHLGIVCADLAAMAKRLRGGDIPVKGETHG